MGRRGGREREGGDRERRGRKRVKKYRFRYLNW